MADENAKFVYEGLDISGFVNVLKVIEKNKDDPMFWETSEMIMKTILDGVQKEQHYYILVALLLAIYAGRNFMDSREEEYEEGKALLSMVIAEPVALIKYYVFNYDQMMSNLKLGA